VKTVAEKRGVIRTCWKHEGDLTPLLPRQALEAAEPEAYLSYDAFASAYDTHLELCKAGGKAFENAAIAAVPILLASHAWETAEHADPTGSSLAKIATNLARMMPTYQAWGFEDMGVFIDMPCMYHALPGVERSAEQHAAFLDAQKQLNVWWSSRHTSVYLVDSAERAMGWQFFERSLLNLFKEPPPSKPFKLKGSLCPFWTKITQLDAEDLADDPGGVNPQAGMPKRRPPLSSPHFTKMLAAMRFERAADRSVVEHLYRAAVEDGFNSLDKLIFTRLDWTDEEVAELAHCLIVVPCPSVTVLDLSWNDMRTGDGLEAIGTAILHGALHSLQRLNLTNCTAIKTMPKSLEECLELKEIHVDGCVQLRHLPPGMSKLASLKILSVINCHALDEEDYCHLPGTVKIITTKEEKEGGGVLLAQASPRPTLSPRMVGTPRASKKL